jgi:hypothetical protein
MILTWLKKLKETFKGLGKFKGTNEEFEALKTVETNGGYL